MTSVEQTVPTGKPPTYMMDRPSVRVFIPFSHVKFLKMFPFFKPHCFRCLLSSRESVGLNDDDIGTA